MINNMNLHCIGDSHTSFFTGYNVIQAEYPNNHKTISKNIFTYRLGSPLAYNLCEPNSKTKGREKLFDILGNLNYETDIIILSFGEVDCRAHIIKQSELKNITIEAAVHECVFRYLLVLKEICSLKFKVIVWNAIPTAMGFENEKFEYSYYGTFQQRNKACILFNELLQIKVLDFGFHFIDVYKLIILKNLKTDERYYFDKIHLGNKLLPLTLKIINQKIPKFKIRKNELLKLRIRIFLNTIRMEEQIDIYINSIKKIFNLWYKK